MTSKPDRRWLPRFGLKWLFALVLVVAAYFGSWPWVEERALENVDAAALKRHQVEMKNAFPDGLSFWHRLIVSKQSCTPSSVAPYLISADESEFDGVGIAGDRRRYYLWLFGWAVRLPFTSTERVDAINITKIPASSGSAILRAEQAAP